MGAVYSRTTVSFEGKWVLPFQVKKIVSLWLIQETKKITEVLDVKLNKSASLYHCIVTFIKFWQVENELNNTFKFRWDNVYETMEMARGETS